MVIDIMHYGLFGVLVISEVSESDDAIDQQFCQNDHKEAMGDG